ncbi:MAG: hypothetical protein IJL00_04715 [Clostridia bacterium]|nr:hypothetical protein [Clostridia bacterium]MBQ6092956.1 hypothetical protein [Clostridia bacterium]
MNGMGELYLQYEHCIAVQKRVIDRNRRRLRQALHAANAGEVQRLNKVLRVLYEEKSELEERAQGLREYLQ